MPEKRKYVVNLVHKYIVEAESQEEAEQMVWEMSYGESVDCYTESEEY